MSPGWDAWGSHTPPPSRRHPPPTRRPHAAHPPPTRRMRQSCPFKSSPVGDSVGFDHSEPGVCFPGRAGPLAQRGAQGAGHRTLRGRSGAAVKLAGLFFEFRAPHPFLPYAVPHFSHISSLILFFNLFFKLADGGRKGRCVA